MGPGPAAHHFVLRGIRDTGPGGAFFGVVHVPDAVQRAAMLRRAGTHSIQDT